MNEEAQQTIELIRNAFKGVVLGNGMGLHEGDGADDYADEATAQKYREEDEKLNWETIPSENLNKYQAALSYFDPEGMRFHIPAFMIADIKKELGVGPIFSLAYLNNYMLEKYTLLSPLQRKAVRAYLLLVKKDSNYKPDVPHIEQALTSYWTEG
jgi:hypothetical protein